MAKGLKRKAWDWMSKYVRLRDSINYCRRVGMSLDSGVGQCCTCGKIVVIKMADAGHFISKGMGGGSGVYFDERNVNLQCRSCNRFQQGNAQAYNDFMLKKYGQKVIDELRRLDKIPRKYNFIALAEFYKLEYKKLNNLI